MAVKITNESTTEERTRNIHLAIENVPDFPRPYAPTQTIRPQTVRIILRQEESGPWYHARSYMSGPRVLSNGREGTGLSDDFSRISDAPEWLREIIHERIDGMNS